MAVPSRYPGDFLLTDRTESVLLFPEMAKPAFPLERVCHVNVETFFIVVLPLRIIGVGLAFDFGVSLNGHAPCLCEEVFLTLHFSIKDPIVPFDGLEVFLRDPGIGFLGVSSFHPPSQCSIDRVVYVMKHVCADDVAMILCPPPNDGIEHQDQSARRQRVVLLDDVPELFQVSKHILLRWFNQQFVLLSCFVLAYVLTQEIEPILNMRDAGFLA